MSILIIINGGLVEYNDQVIIENGTGLFLEQLKKEIDSHINLFQLIEKADVHSGINNYILSQDYNIQTVKFHKGYRKIVTYIIALLKILFSNEKFSLTYIFYPGNISFLIAIRCILYKQPYGLYVRGEYNKGILSNLIFKKAKFINTIGTVFLQNIIPINPNCNLIRPMLKFDISQKPNSNTVEKIDEILFVGRIEKPKGIWEILKVAEKLKDSYPQYKYRLIGSGADIDEAREYIVKKNLHNIILSGPIFDPNELKIYYQRAKIFLFPSHNEGFPRVLYEALYFGVPIITTFVGNIPGIMKNEFNCLEISPNSVESIMLQLPRLINNDLLAKSLVNNGYSTLDLIFNPSIKLHSSLVASQYKEF